MSIEAMKQALEALQKLTWAVSHPDNVKIGEDGQNTLRQAIQEEALRNVARLGQEIEQEPVAWIYEFGTDHCDAVTPVRWYKNVTALKKPDPNENLVRNVRPLYLEPQREWVWLTEEEIALVCAECAASAHNWNDISFARAIEAKLKERNHDQRA